MKTVLASDNAGKLRELAALLAPLGFEIVTQSRFGITSAEETGATFEDNALLKARHAARLSGLPALADDSGIEVDALEGRPGVYSARYAGPGATDMANLELLLRELTGVPHSERTARYRCVLAFVRTADDASPLLAAGTWEGAILEAPRGEGGFGYDPVFLPQGTQLSAAQMTAEAKNAVSHRAQALRRLVDLLGAVVPVVPG